MSDLHSTPMMSPMDSFPRERIITSGTSWYQLVLYTQYHFNTASLIGIGTPFLRASLVAQTAVMREAQIRSLGQEDPLEKGMATHSNVFA